MFARDDVERKGMESPAWAALYVRRSGSARTCPGPARAYKRIMDRAFAGTLAMMVWPDVYTSEPPQLSTSLPDGRSLMFSDRLVILFGPRDDEGREPYLDSVPLEALAHHEDEAQKLAGWLALRDALQAGVERFESGFSVWCTREDGKILEVGSFGYQLYDTMEDYLNGGRCLAALRNTGS
jgi:hypothetical protein